MSYINGEELSPLLQNLLVDAGAAISGEVHLQINDNSLFNVDVQTVVQDSGNYVLHVTPESLHDEYAIVNNKTRAASHILYTISDSQCCVVFSIDENGVKTIQNYMNNTEVMTLFYNQFFRLNKDYLNLILIKDAYIQ